MAVDKAFLVRLDQTQHARLNVAARETACSKASVIRIALERFLDREGF